MRIRVVTPTTCCRRRLTSEAAMNTHRTGACSSTFGLVVIAVTSAIALAASATALPASAAEGHRTEDSTLPDHLMSSDGGGAPDASVWPDHVADADGDALGGSVSPDHLVHGVSRDVSATSLGPDHLVQGEGRETSGAWPDHLVSTPRSVARLQR